MESPTPKISRQPGLLWQTSRTPTPRQPLVLEKIIIEVDWPYYNDDQFHDPGAEAKSRIGIDGFKLDWNTGGYFNYKLTINASEKWDYTFYDQDGDHYTIDVNCIWWSHDVCFDTDHNKQPNIRRVKAERG
ncbi:hypothetical protein BJ165DRAFT_1469147 [Panaeolus papilionaceus]|nr:hypothetical protein BJ165DRAFT_1469147 [Panaeolus papilionaceus]